jgi:hypothetical protein
MLSITNTWVDLAPDYRESGLVLRPLMYSSKLCIVRGCSSAEHNVFAGLRRGRPMVNLT